MPEDIWMTVMLPAHLDTNPAFVATRELFGFAGERWTILVLGVLRSGRQRFGGLRKAIPGVSQKQLSFTLRHLERDGYVLRTAYATIPPRVDYELTPLGTELIEQATAFGRFAVSRLPQIEAARTAFDRNQAAPLSALAQIPA